MHNNWGVIIQARTGSTRLPNKMLLPFYKEKNLLETILDNLTQTFDPSKIVLATTKKLGDNEIETIAKKNKITCYRGSEDNVLSRFVEAAMQMGWTHIIRVCADNPFLLTSSLKTLAEKGQQSEADYLAFFFSDNTPTIKTHSGFFAEWVSVEALKKVESQTQLPLYLEHVTNYIYSHPEDFTIEKLSIEEEELIRKIRLTIDTKEDFQLAQQLFLEVKNQMDKVTWKEIKNAIQNTPSYLKNMDLLIKNNQK